MILFDLDNENAEKEGSRKRGGFQCYVCVILLITYTHTDYGSGVKTRCR